MISLSTNYISEVLHNYTDFRNTVNKISSLSSENSLNVIGLKGALNAYFIIDYLKDIYAKRLQNVKYLC